MECFIKKILEGRTDEQAHSQFVRFGKGRYAGRAALSLVKNEKIKLSGSYEYANDFVLLIAELGDAKFSGIILSKEKLNLQGKVKAGINECGFDGDSSKVKEIKDKAYFMLLDAEGLGIGLKMKKKLPKLGKSGALKIDDKFCQLEADLRYWSKIKEAFLWDLQECKKAKISHEYIIDEIILPKGEKDFEKIRLLARRKGKLIRKLTIDGQEKISEKEVEV